MVLMAFWKVAGVDSPGQFNDALIGVIFHGSCAQIHGVVMGDDGARRTQQVALWIDQQARCTQGHDGLSWLRGAHDVDVALQVHFIAIR